MEGVAKGLRTVVKERYGEDAIKGFGLYWIFQLSVSLVLLVLSFAFQGMKQDEHVEILEAEEDFQSGKTLLEEVMAEMGARVIFLPKFHPEFAPIECNYRCGLKVF